LALYQITEIVVPGILVKCAVLLMSAFQHVTFNLRQMATSIIDTRTYTCELVILIHAWLTILLIFEMKPITCSQLYLVLSVTQMLYIATIATLIYHLN